MRFIAPLIDLWVGGDTLNFALTCEILPTLTTLFPLLNADNAGVLPPKQRKLLYSALSPKTNRISKWQEKVSEESYVLCVVEAVRALTRIGDTGALPTLRPLLHIKGETQWHQQIRAVVGECLLKLELIAKEETSAKVLLRPSTFEDRTGETLLRTLPHTPEDKPETLLRAVDEAKVGDTIET